MDVDFVYRIIKASAILGALGFLFVAQAFGLDVGFGFLAGAAWNTLNLWMMSILITAAFDEQANKKKLLMAAILKFPALYGGGFFLLVYAGLHIGGAIAGFSLPFVVAALKAGGIIMAERSAVPLAKSGEADKTSDCSVSPNLTR